MFNGIDTDRNGYIEFSEFVIAAMNQDTLTSLEKLEAVFNMFDENGDSHLSADEIRKILCLGGTNSWTIEEVNEIIREVDENGNG